MKYGGGGADDVHGEVEVANSHREIPLAPVHLPVSCHQSHQIYHFLGDDMAVSSPAMAASCHQSHVKVIRFIGDDKVTTNFIKVMCHQINHFLGDDMTEIIFLMRTRL